MRYQVAIWIGLVLLGWWGWRWIATTPAALLAWNALFAAAWSVASCAYIETGIYVLEQDRFSTPNGSAAVLLLATVLFFLCARATIARLPVVPVSPAVAGNDFQYRLVLAAAATALVLLYINLALSPVPYFDKNVDRFSYWQYSRLPFLHTLLGNTTSMLAFILALGYARAARRGERRTVYVLGLIAYIAYLILIGHKFSAISLALLLWFFPIVALRTERIRLNLKVVGSVVLVAATFGTLTFLQYDRSFNPYGDIDTLGAIEYRVLGLQGHLFWGIWEERIVGGIGPTWSPRELMSGMETLMERYGGAGMGFDEERGVSFTAGYPGVLLHVLPVVPATLLHLFLGVLLGFASWYLYRLIRTARIIEACIMLQLGLWYDHVVTMGTFSQVVNVAAAIVIAIFIVRESYLAAAPAPWGEPRQATGGTAA